MEDWAKSISLQNKVLGVWVIKLPTTRLQILFIIIKIAIRETVDLLVNYLKIKASIIMQIYI